MDSNPLWYKTAVFYQLHVRAFLDADADGIGDFAGLTRKLDYLQDLGVTALWLLPFYPSPLKDDGYDISDYRGIHPSYGTLADFREFLREAHRRGLHVVTELVLNHTSDQHPWFQRARRAPQGSKERDYYVWSDTSDRYTQARIIFQDYESSNWSWDPVAHAYYWHRFFLHQPDLNFDNPEVREQIAEVLDYWLDMGVDGLRLDGVPYLYEREGTTCENLPETHDFLKSLRARVDSQFSGRMFLAEANQWPEDAARYFGDGDECHTAFHFPVMPRMYLAIQMEDRFPIIDILEQTPSIPENCQWMLFLRNHDELTLEMVTEQERDAMYRFYARDPQARLNLGIRRRLSPLLDNDRRKIELLNGLLLSLPGTPIIYYGDEIGMGDNIYLGDRNGVRTPMQWTADRNAGFSQANPQQLYLPPIIDYQYHYETVNVETLKAEPNSLLCWMRRVIRLRRELRPLAEGEIEFLHPDNHKVLAFLRVRPGSDGEPDETVLIVANLSHSAQFVELDLSTHREKTPIEAFGRIRFPRIGELPYLLTLTPYAFYWFVLESDTPAATASSLDLALPQLATRNHWQSLFDPPSRAPLEAALQRYLSGQRFATHAIQRVAVQDVVAVDPAPPSSNAPNADARPEFSESPLPPPHLPMAIVLAQVESETGEESIRAIPLGFMRETEPTVSDTADPARAVARLTIEYDRFCENGVVADCFHEPQLCRRLLESLRERRVFHGRSGSISTLPTAEIDENIQRMFDSSDGRFRALEQTNSLLVYNNRVVVKLYRRIEEGPHPEVEMARYLAAGDVSDRFAPILGVFEYHDKNNRSSTVGVVHEFIHHDGTARDLTLDTLENLLEASHPDTAFVKVPTIEAGHRFLVDRGPAEVPREVRLLLGDYLDRMVLLGRRTAEFHDALAKETDNLAFTPERLLPFHRRSLYQNVRNVLGRALRHIKASLDDLPSQVTAPATEILAQGAGRLFPADGGLPGLHDALHEGVVALRIRGHGNYRLEDILRTSDDFVMVDFEGDAELPLTQRRMKTSPLRDVASLLWSLERIGLEALFEFAEFRELDDAALAQLRKRIDFWNAWAAAAFLGSYLDSVMTPQLLPTPSEAIRPLLELYFAEKCVSMLLRDLDHLAWAREDAIPSARLSMLQSLELLRAR